MSKPRKTGDVGISKSTLAGSLPAFFVPLSLLQDPDNIVNDRAQSGKKRGSTFLTLSNNKLCFAVATGEEANSPWTLIGTASGGGGAAPDLSNYYTRPETDSAIASALAHAAPQADQVYKYGIDSIGMTDDDFSGKNFDTGMDLLVAKLKSLYPNEDAVKFEMSIRKDDFPHFGAALLPPKTANEAFSVFNLEMLGQHTFQYTSYDIWADTLYDGSFKLIGNQVPSVQHLQWFKQVTNNDVSFISGFNQLGVSDSDFAGKSRKEIVGLFVQKLAAAAPKSHTIYYDHDSDINGTPNISKAFPSDVGGNTDKLLFTATLVARNNLKLTLSNLKTGRSWWLNVFIEGANTRDAAWNEYSNDEDVSAFYIKGLGELGFTDADFANSYKEAIITKLILKIRDVGAGNDVIQYYQDATISAIPNLKAILPNGVGDDVDEILITARILGGNNIRIEVTNFSKDRMWWLTTMTGLAHGKVMDWNEYSIDHKDTVFHYEGADLPDISNTDDKAYYITITDDGSGSARESLPIPDNLQVGSTFYLNNKDSTETIVLDTAADEKINGGDNLLVEHNRKVLLQKVSDTEWFKIGNGNGSDQPERPVDASNVDLSEYITKPDADALYALKGEVGGMLTRPQADRRYMKVGEGIVNPRAKSSVQEDLPYALVNKEYVDGHFFKNGDGVLHVGQGVKQITIDSERKGITLPVGGFTLIRQGGINRMTIGDNGEVSMYDPHAIGDQGSEDHSLVQLKTVLDMDTANSHKFDEIDAKVTQISQKAQSADDAGQYAKGEVEAANLKLNDIGGRVTQLEARPLASHSAKAPPIPAVIDDGQGHIVSGRLKRLNVLDDSGIATFDDAKNALSLDLRTSPIIPRRGLPQSDVPMSPITKLTNIGYMSYFSKNIPIAQTFHDASGGTDTRVMPDCDFVSHPYVRKNDDKTLTVYPLGDEAINKKSQYIISMTVKWEDIPHDDSCDVMAYVWDERKGDYLMDDNGDYLAIQTHYAQNKPLIPLILAGTISLEEATDISFHIASSSSVELNITDGGRLVSAVMLQALTKEYKTGLAMLQYEKSMGNNSRFYCHDYNHDLGNLHDLVADGRNVMKDYNSYNEFLILAKQMFLQAWSSTRFGSTPGNGDGVVLEEGNQITDKNSSMHALGFQFTAEDAKALSGQEITFHAKYSTLRYYEMKVLEWVGSPSVHYQNIIRNYVGAGSTPILESGWKELDGQHMPPIDPADTAEADITITVPIGAKGMAFVLIPTADVTMGGMKLDEFSLSMATDYSQFDYKLGTQTPDNLFPTVSVLRSTFDFSGQLNAIDYQSLSSRPVPFSVGVVSRLHTRYFSDAQVKHDIPTILEQDHKTPVDYIEFEFDGRVSVKVNVYAAAGSTIPDGKTAPIIFDWATITDGAMTAIANTERNMYVSGGSPVVHQQEVDFELNVTKGTKYIMRAKTDSSGHARIVQPVNLPAISYEFCKLSTESSS